MTDQPARRPWATWVVAGTGLLIATAVIATLVLSHLSRAVQVRTVGFTVQSATSTTLDFEVTKRPEDAVSCVAVALDRDHVEVGRREGIEVAATPMQRTTRHRVEITTRSEPVAAQVESCVRTGHGG